MACGTCETAAKYAAGWGDDVLNFVRGGPAMEPAETLDPWAPGGSAADVSVWPSLKVIVVAAVIFYIVMRVL